MANPLDVSVSTRDRGTSIDTSPHHKRNKDFGVDESLLAYLNIHPIDFLELRLNPERFSPIVIIFGCFASLFGDP